MGDASVVPLNYVEVVMDYRGMGRVVNGDNLTLLPFIFSWYAFVGFFCFIQILPAFHLKVWAMYVLRMMRVSPLESNTYADGFLLGGVWPC